MRLTIASAALIVLAAATTATATSPLRGTYVEARTCQVYTGPCFANGEVGLTGKDAVMAWSVQRGAWGDVDLRGLGVAVIVKASETLGFNGLEDAATKTAVIVVDADADANQAQALRDFAIQQVQLSEAQIKATDRAELELDFDFAELTAAVKLGRYGHVQARRARPGDCICSNESAYYPPLTSLTGFVPGVAIDAEVTARQLGTRWSIPGSRSVYLGTFELNETPATSLTKL